MSVPVSAAPELLDFLSSGDAEEREVSIGLLAELVASAYGKDGVVLGEIVRDTGGLELLSQLLSDVSEQTRLGTLQVLVNLCSDAVDPNSAKTKRGLLEHGAGVPMLEFTKSEDPDAQMLACAALQNMVSEPGWARLVVEQGYTDHLERLADADNPMVVRYASGALKNVIVTLRNAGDDFSASQDSLDAVARRTLQTKLEVFAYNRAARLLAKAVREIPSEVRARDPPPPPAAPPHPPSPPGSTATGACRHACTFPSVTRRAVFSPIEAFASPDVRRCGCGGCWPTRTRRWRRSKRRPCRRPN